MRRRPAGESIAEKRGAVPLSDAAAVQENDAGVQTSGFRE